MKKVLKVCTVVTLMAVMLAMAVGCNPAEEQPDWKFEVGEDRVTYKTEGAADYADTLNIYLKIVGGGNDVLFNGIVTITTSTYTIGEVFRAATSSKGLAYNVEGIINTIGDYTGNSETGYWWMYEVNGEFAHFGLNEMQIRNNDYILLEYKKSTM